MKKIYWQVQQLYRFGGAELVSVDLANELSKDPNYDVTIISTTELGESFPCHIEPTLKVESLNIPKCVERVDVYTKKYLKHFRIISLIILYCRVSCHYFFKRGVYRRRMQKRLLEEDATLICSAVDSYMLAPKKGKVFFHFHFDASIFFRGDNYPVFKISRKPDKWIFLTKRTLDRVIEKLPELKDKSTYIFNPVRFERVLDTTYHNNTLIFAGNFNTIKNPMLALEVAYELKKRNFSFILKMFGNPVLIKEMKAYIEEKKIEDVVELHDPSTTIREEILASDLLLLTSESEGFCLAMAEANSLSRPWVSSFWDKAIDEIYEDGKAGIVIRDNKATTFATKIIEILNDKEKLIEWKKSAYESSYRFSKEKIIPEWKKIL